MIERSTCVICGKRELRRGWCNAHYIRWQRYGDPLSGGETRGSRNKFYKEVVSTYEGDECLIWPFARNPKGYAVLGNKRGDQELVSRRICEETHGQHPDGANIAAHSCGKGHLGCVNRHHLSWKTPAGNSADMVAHGNSLKGEKNHAAKITRAEAMAIRALRSIVPQRELARRYGLSPSSIARIQTGQAWGWLTSAM